MQGESRKRSGERVLLLVLQRKGKKTRDAGDVAEEMRELIYSCGGNVIDSLIVSIEKPSSNYYLRKGKLEEVLALTKTQKIGSVIVSIDLSPIQSRNLSEYLKVKIVDRTGLILDIFAQHAHSKDGKVQVELAQLMYLMPRLSMIWEKFSRLGGGIGTRGPGEKMLEVDKRKIRKRITKLNDELERLRTHRELIRKSRKRKEFTVVSIVGYTNAGKSTLLRYLTGADILVEDKLFATLDPVTRRYVLPSGKTVLFTDTVGFLLDLPHGLIKSFHATLEEILDADLIVIVLDASNPEYVLHYQVVQKTLKEINAESRKQLIVFNKVDLVDPVRKLELATSYPDGVFISAAEGIGIDSMINAVQKELSKGEN